MAKSLVFLSVLCCLALTPCLGFAAEYHVGSGQPYATVNDLLLVVTLGDNDIVWVHPGTYPNFWVRAGGGSSQAAAVQIRLCERFPYLGYLQSGTILIKAKDA